MSLTVYMQNCYTAAQEYCSQIPRNTPKVMVCTGLAGFILTVVIEKNLKAGLICAALWASATAIYGIISPLFAKFTNRERLTFNEEMCRTLLPIIFVAAVAKGSGHDRPLKTIGITACFEGLRVYFSGNERKDVFHTSAIFV